MLLFIPGFFVLGAIPAPQVILNHWTFSGTKAYGWSPDPSVAGAGETQTREKYSTPNRRHHKITVLSSICWHQEENNNRGRVYRSHHWNPGFALSSLETTLKNGRNPDSPRDLLPGNF